MNLRKLLFTVIITYLFYFYKKKTVILICGNIYATNTEPHELKL